jgi:hypothetical protein
MELPVPLRGAVTAKITPLFYRDTLDVGGRRG